jgi:RNA polymerase sigma factor (sigma-70 family)
MTGRIAAQAELIRRAQRGDREAFGQLAAQEMGRLYATAYLVLRAPEPARDATQEALLDAWRGLTGLRDPARFGPWLHRLLLRRCVRNLRRADREIGMEPTVVPSTSDGTAAVADRDQLVRGFRRLTAEQRMILVQRYYLDLPVERVAETLGIPPGTVKSRTNRALAALRAVLEADDRAPALPVRETQP